MGAQFQIFQDRAGEFRFNLQAPNGEKILHSEGYAQKGSCLAGVASVKANATDRANFETYVDTARQYRFRLRARNHEIIGTSEGYVSAQGCDAGIKSVMQNAPIATIDDRTT